MAGRDFQIAEQRVHISGQYSAATARATADELELHLRLLTQRFGELLPRRVTDVSVAPARRVELPDLFLEVDVDGTAINLHATYDNEIYNRGCWSDEGIEVQRTPDEVQIRDTALGHEVGHLLYNMLPPHLLEHVRTKHAELLENYLFPKIKKGRCPATVANEMLSSEALVQLIESRRSPQKIANAVQFVVYKGFVGRLTGVYHSKPPNVRKVKTAQTVTDPEEFFCEVVQMYLYRPRELIKKPHNLFGFARGVLNTVMGRDVIPIYTY